MDLQRMQDELDNLTLFVLPEVEGRLADVLAMQEDDPDYEYREQDEQDAREELAEVKGRIARLEARLTQHVPDKCPVCNGQKGFRVGVYWEDCDSCNGTGTCPVQ